MLIYMALEKVLSTGQKAKGTVQKRWVLGDHAGSRGDREALLTRLCIATGTDALRKWVVNGGSQILTRMWICTDEQGDESRTIATTMD